MKMEFQYLLGIMQNTLPYKEYSIYPSRLQF